MSATRYIHIRNWDRFQHYKQRGAPWIKDYTAQIHDDDYMNLSLSQVGLLQRLRLWYAASGERGISEDIARHKLSTGAAEARRVRGHLEALNHAGFIRFSASKVLDECKHDASPEVETETEVETEQDQDQNPNPTPPIARPAREPEPEPQNGLGGAGGTNDQYGPQPIGQTVEEILQALRGAA